MIILVLWIVGFIICWILDNIRYKKILEKEEKSKQIEVFSLSDRHFYYVKGYLVITVLFLFWYFNKVYKSL